MPQTLTSPQLLTVAEIKEFGSATGPCVTVFLPAHVRGGAKHSLSARFKAAAQLAEEKLSERGVVSTLIRKIVDPIVAVGGQVDKEHNDALAIFSADHAFRRYQVSIPLEESVIAADNFFIRPFLKTIEGEKQFYLLALSQKDIRLLRCTGHSSEEVELGKHIPHSLHEDMGTDKPDHVLENHSTPGPSSGSSKGVMFGTGTGKEDRNEYLLHFYKDVSKGLIELLKGQEKTPLVVCGVEYELALFDTVNAWANTCPGGVKGAPNGFKGGEMHARALECLDRMEQAEIDALVAQHDKQAGEAAAAGVNDVVKAAYEGRVQHLFAAENAQAMGNFDEASHRARTHQVPRAGDECLINAAAVQTIVHGGRVHMLPQARVPGNRPMAAIMRY